MFSYRRKHTLATIYNDFMNIILAAGANAGHCVEQYNTTQFYIEMPLQQDSRHKGWNKKYVCVISMTRCELTDACDAYMRQ